MLHLHNYKTHKHPSPMATTSTVPTAASLLAILNNPERVSEQDIKQAKKDLKRCYPQMWAVWQEHNG